MTTQLWRVPWKALWVAAMLAAMPAAAQEIALEASLDRNPVWVNQTFTYRLEVSGQASSMPEPNLPPFSEFRVVAGPNTSTSFQIINGKVSSNKTLSVTLMPRRVGEFTIPPVDLRHEGRLYRSNAVTVRVTSQQPGAATDAPGEAAGRLFMRVIPSKRSVYLGEPLDVSFRVYFRVPIRNPDFVKLPETVGFWVEEYELPQNIPIEKETIGGVEYNVAEVKKLALFPTKTGTLGISPMQLALQVVERRSRRDPFSLMDDFFDDPFGRTVRKILVTDSVSIAVKPLPAAGRPANFTGLVGRFRIDTDIDKGAVETNEAISYKVRLAGNGTLKSLSDLPLTFPTSFEVYDPKVKDAVDKTAGRPFSASRELEYVLIPRRPGEFEIPAVALAYFDPAQGRYRTLETRPYTIEVSQGANLAGDGVPGYVPKSDVTLLGRDIHFIKEGNLSLVSAGAKPYRSAWFYGTLALPLLLVGLAYGYRSHLDKMSTNQEYARRRTAFKQAHRRLKGAEARLKDGDLQGFYGEASGGLIGFVADKTNRPAAGLVRGDVEALLRERRVDDELVDEYLRYLDEADFRRFAPGDHSETDARAFFERAAEMLERLGKALN